MHDLDLSKRLHGTESDFLTALEGDTTMLASFYHSWITLSDSLRTASKTGSVCNETLYLAHSVASRIANLANCFLDIKCGVESSTISLQKDCDAILHQMATLDLNTNPKSLPLEEGNDTYCSRSYSTTPISNADGSYPPFVTTARQWLLDNLHNPYPTANVKAQMAATSSCQVTSVNSWFINARRRIGWTTLCRERFSNCRADMIDAAYRVLVEEDPYRALSPELRHSFVAIKVAAEGLYSSALIRSAFAEDLDAMVKDVTEEERRFVGPEKLSKVGKASSTKVVRRYPSPKSSTSSPVPALSGSLTDESNEGEDVAPPIIAGAKRSRSSVELVDELSSTVNRPIKRLRASATPRMCLPSPSSSTDGVDIPSSDSSPETFISLELPPQTVQVLSPRTRYPETNTAGGPQSPSDPLASSRLPTVSDHLPRSHIENEYSIDDWFNTNFSALFDIPPPIVATEPDLSAPWEVELFTDYSIPENIPKCPPASTVEAAISAPNDLSDLDGLLQSICSDSFAPPSNILPTNIMGGYPASLDSSFPDISPTNLDWMSLLNDAETYQPTVCSTFPQYPTNSRPLPEIDLSMLQLPRVIPAVNTPSDFASKKAKLHQLHSMQEAVRKMEQELRFEGIAV